jgi:hypothetical protein
MNTIKKGRGNVREGMVDQYGREKSAIARFIDKYSETLIK